jgi:hypothetical protein
MNKKGEGGEFGALYTNAYVSFSTFHNFESSNVIRDKFVAVATVLNTTKSAAIPNLILHYMYVCVYEIL